MPAEAQTHPDHGIITATRHNYQTMNDSHAHKQTKMPHLGDSPASSNIWNGKNSPKMLNEDKMVNPEDR